jgi:hypothetical protein
MASPTQNTLNNTYILAGFGKNPVFVQSRVQAITPAL